MGIGRVLKRVASWCAPWALVISGRSGKRRAVAITFDDGPHSENTPRILDTLSVYGATATFFLQANMAEKYPELVREIVRRGHQVGNHGYAHPDAKAVSTRNYVADVMRAQLVLENIVGHELPRVFRPPFGNITPRSMFSLLRQGFCFVFWSHDSRDSYLPDPDELLKYVTKLSIPAGSILLFHDDYAHTAEILPKLLFHLAQGGLQIVSVGELVSKQTR
jgi:peptidoglycan-N-acetylglucosamine deacetylase